MDAVLYYVGLVLSFIAALGFAVFCVGFFSGLGHLIYINGSDEMLPTHRLRSVWGVMIMLACFVFWEIVQFFVGLVTGETALLGFWCLVAVITLIVLGWLVKLVRGGGGGH